MKTNLLNNLPNDLSNEVIQTLIDAKNIRIERIISNGHTSPQNFYYDQTQNEYIILLQGHAKLEIQPHPSNQPQTNLAELKTGDALLIPAHQKHRVTWTTPNQPTIWLAIHYDS